MIRIFSMQGFYELCKHSHFLASCVTKRQIFSFVPVSSVSHHRVYPLTRHLSTGSPMWKDALYPQGDKSEQAETIELDKWKSVMRSKAALEALQASNEEEEGDDDEDENLAGAGGDSSSLIATRELVSMWRQAGKLVPQEISDEEVKILAEFTTKSSRKKYLKYLAITECRKRARKAKREQKKAKREASMEGVDRTREEVKNTFLLQFWTRSLDKLLAWRSAQAMRFGQPLVFDMSYDSKMSRREIENTVLQLMDVEGWNRRAVEPFHLHFCNLQPDGAYMKELLRRYNTETWDQLFVTTTDRQHVDVFPSEQLVYLTADSPNVLRAFDHSKVYIIGAMVDRSIQPGVSLANAKRLKLETARLPLDQFLQWEMGGKNLTLDQMIRIMLTIKETGNWEKALEFVPKRKHDGFHQQQAQKEMTDGPRESTDVSVRSWERSDESKFINVDRSPNRPQKEPGFTGRGTNTERPRDSKYKPSDSRVRLSFKNHMDGMKNAGRNKKWWNDQ